MPKNAAAPTARTYSIIETIDFAGGVIYLDTGEEVPITNMFDIDSEATSDHDLVMAIVAGPMKNGRWIAHHIGERLASGPPLQ